MLSDWRNGKGFSSLERGRFGGGVDRVTVVGVA